jgi:hypothetical protein
VVKQAPWLRETSTKPLTAFTVASSCGAGKEREMAEKDNPVATVAVGPLLGRTIILGHYLESLQSVLHTLAIESREHCEKVQEDFMLGLLHLGQCQIDEAKKELAAMSAKLVAAERKHVEEGGR